MRQNMKRRPNGEKVRERIALFILCGLVLIGFYLVIGLLVLPMVMETLSAWDETGKEEMLNRMIFLGMTLLYVLPLYMVYFSQNAAYKRFVLEETRERLDWKPFLRKFMSVHGCWDIVLYAGYSVIYPIGLLSNIKPIRQYIGFLYIQQTVFYEIPVPAILSYVFAVVVFVLQYLAAAAFAAGRWNKQRLHRD